MPLEAAVPTRSARSGAPTILVVEDDRSIRYLFTEVLRGAGYIVIACEDGTLGLEAARSCEGGIHAVVTDAAMPGLECREMIAQIRALHPGIPVVVVSGSFEEGVSHPSADATTLFLPKPLSPDRLKGELRRLLMGVLS